MNCPICNGPMWDNRPKKQTGEFSSKAPDFKCRDKDCGAVVWPEKENPKYTPKMAEKAKEIREKIEEAKPRDFDFENRGKVRHGIVVAILETGHSLDLSEEEKQQISELTNFVMTGK